MGHADFIHLRVHSAYSLAEGAIHVAEAVTLAKHHRMPALGITDTGNMFGALEFSIAGAGAGIQPIPGCAIGLARPEDPPPGALQIPPPDRIALLAQDDVGYGNLMALTSQGYLQTDPGQAAHVTWDYLAEHSQGLLAMTGGLAGPVGRLLADGQDDHAKQALVRLAEMFPGRLYVELQRHGLEVEGRIEPALLEMAYANALPLVATNDVFFATEDMFEAHDALLCIADGAYVSQSDRRRVTPEHRFKSPQEMRALFADVPEAADNTLVIAQRCAFRPPQRDPILPSYSIDSGRSEEDELRTLSEQGLLAHLTARSISDQAPYMEQLDHEIEVITNMGFAGYFLIVADFIRFARRQGIPVGPGRGSGAGSVVAWGLGITDLDPLEFGLLFERFLNPHRVSMPDFDIDFCQERRDEVILYVQNMYGADRVAQIITFGSLQARAVLRDVGRVLEMPYGHVDRICKMVPNNPANPTTLAEAVKSEDGLREERDTDETVAKMLDIGGKLEGLYRHASTHAAGVVISDRPLTELVPLYRDPRSEMPVTQFSMKFVEKAGLVKFDFLGLKTLTVIDKAMKLLEKRGVSVDLGAIPLDDEKTFAMLGRAETVGVFQLESGGMRDLTRDVVPTGIEDLIAIVALFRPGPMENIPKYVAAKHGREAPEQLHELIDPVVADTYGVIIYQEQVMQIAQVFAGYDMGEADLLRRAMGKKIQAEMDAQRQRFLEGAKANGVSAERANHVFDLVNKFAGYGFNKAHSSGYALIAYQTAYLKAHFPVEFLAASMTVDSGNTDKLSVFKEEAKRLGIDVIPPDINSSGVAFTVDMDQGAIRYALGAVKNVGAQAMESVVAEREANGPFESLADFAGRIDPKAANRRQLENLAAAGAFDGLEPNRAQAFASVQPIGAFAAAASHEREAGQSSLFGGESGTDGRELVVAPVKPWSQVKVLNNERDAVGFFLSAHPLEAYEAVLADAGVIPSNQLEERAGATGGMFVLAGTVERKIERRSARGNRYAHIGLSDPSGGFDVTVFSELLESAGALLEPGSLVVVGVEAKIEEESLRVTAQSIRSVNEIAGRSITKMEISVDGVKGLKALGVALGPPNGGHAEVSVIVSDRAVGGDVEIALPGRYSIVPEVEEALAQTPGVKGLRGT
ncbi:MAG: DNA polymerase III subunit alpha [Alphaproteobacteria bacterium]|jgi:DNA polymerase III subunit alpha|nr:DNA polymerase III subunit alpha [Alphaproteobacteria bacterium]